MFREGRVTIYITVDIAVDIIVDITSNITDVFFYMIFVVEYIFLRGLVNTKSLQRNLSFNVSLAMVSY